MQKLKFAAAFLLPVYFLLAGCDNSNPTGNDEPKKGIDSRLVGEWECYKMVTAGIPQEFPENSRTKMSLTSNGSYELAADNGTWRTSNDSLYLKSSINNVEIFYALYEISGSEVVLDIAGNQQYYKKTGGNDKPDNIEKASLYGNWTCYQMVFYEDGEDFVWSEEDEDWESMVLSFSATQIEMTYGDQKESGTWDLQDDLIVASSDGETSNMKIISFSNGILVLEDDEGSLSYYTKG